MDLPSLYPNASSMVETEDPHCTWAIGLTCKWTLKTLIFFSENANYLEIITENEPGWWLFSSGDLWNHFSPNICGGLEASPVIGSYGHNHTCATCEVAEGACMAEILFLVSACEPSQELLFPGSSPMWEFSKLEHWFSIWRDAASCLLSLIHLCFVIYLMSPTQPT